MSKWIEKELGGLYSEKPKSKIKVADAAGFGDYPFFTSGDTVLLHNQKLTENANVYLATGGVANVKYYNGEAAFSTDTYVIAAKDGFDTKFLYYYLLDNLDFINSNFFEGSGLKHLQKNDLKEWRLSLPEDVKEQERIAAVLTKADELIDATQELIDKQKKIKIGLMQTLLTCGIDKNGVIRSPKTHKFKDSELGPIPEEWECVELGSYSKSIADGDHMPPPKVEYGIPFVTIGNVKNESIDFSNTMYVGYDYFSSIDIKRKPQKGDVLYTVVASFGIPILMKNDQDFVFQRHIAIIRPKEDFKSEFLFYYLKSEAALKQADDSAVGVAQRTISLTSLRAYKVVKPSLAEQDCIVSILQQQDQIIKDLELEKQKYIDIKKGLMADLLSGKVKVSA